MVYEHESGVTVISRFHWHVATIWTQPILRDGKPSINFTKGIHTPIVESSSYDYGYTDLERTIPLWERIKASGLYVSAFEDILQRNKFGFHTRHHYSDRIVTGGVPSKYLFDLKDLKEAVFIGRMFTRNEVPQVIGDKLWGRA